MTSDHPLGGLKTIREELGVKASAVAARLGVTLTTYYRYENGRRRVYFDHALAIAQMLKVDVNQLTHEPTIDERVALVQRRLEQEERLKRAGGDEAVANVLGDWLDGAQSPPAAPAPISAVEPVRAAPEPAPQQRSVEEMMAELGDWSGGDERDD